MRNNKQGLTLTELIVSVSIIAIILAGVVSFSLSLQGSQVSTRAISEVSNRAIVAISYLVQDASLATGDASDFGVEKIDSVAPDDYLCLRHDQSDPNVYTDDTYVCYVVDSNNLKRIATPTIAALPNSLFVACAASPGTCNITDLGEIATSNFFSIDGATHEVSFTVHVLYDTAQTTSPLTNPEVILETTVNPLSHTSL